MKIVDREIIFKGKILSIFKNSVKNSDGSLWYRETVSYGGNASAVLGVYEKKVVLVSQFRPATKEVLYELPAGKIEKNETPESCAKREFEEEVGLNPKNLRLLFEFYSSPGFAEEKIYLFYANMFEKGNRNLDEGEELSIYFLPLCEINEFLFSGKIKDAKTIIGLLALEVIENGKTKI